MGRCSFYAKLINISSLFGRVSLKHCLILQSFSCQCIDGYGGDGEECEIDPDLDGIPSVGLSCTLPNCYKVRKNFFAQWNYSCACVINELSFL